MSAETFELTAEEADRLVGWFMDGPMSDAAYGPLGVDDLRLLERIRVWVAEQQGAEDAALYTEDL